MGGSESLRPILALMAPGTALRDGLERILRGRTGALIVLGYDRTVESICTGGFELQVEFSATRLRELCKMDGAVVMASDGANIVRAAVHLMPDPTIPSEESGTRHRTAERVAKQSGFPVISVSQSMRIIGLYVNGQRHVLDDSAAILSRANQALATLGATSCGSMRSPAPSPPWRSKIWSPFATRWPWCSGSRWSAASPTRSPATWSSSAPTAACWPSSWMS